jgi:hypothetical protein
MIDKTGEKPEEGVGKGASFTERKQGQAGGGK